MRRVRIGAIALAAAAVVAVATVVALRWTTATSACHTNAQLVPSCGVVWGIAPDPNTNAGLAAAEARLGQHFPLVYRFNDLDDAVPTPEERDLVRSGRFLHLTIDARVFEHPGERVTWSDVTAGRFDASLTRQARGIASLHVPVWLTFDHEPDQPARAASGTPADFVAAWRHVHDVFARAGAANAVWVWVVTGYAATFPTLAQFWPGNAYVDWIGWEAYNSSGCLTGAVEPGGYRSFAQSVLPFLQWLHTSGRAAGIGQDRPLMISEAGTVAYPDDPGRAAGWYRGIGAVLRAHPAIKAITLWDRPGTAHCGYRFDGRPGAPEAIRAARVASKSLGGP